MKKFTLCILAIIMVVSLSACGTDSAEKDTSQADKQTPSGSTEGASFDYTGDFIDDHLNGDYSITYKMLSSETGAENSSYEVKMMRTSEGYYAMLGKDTEMMYIKNKDKYDMYIGDSENGFEKMPEISLSEHEVKAQTQAFLGYMSAYSQFEESLKSTGSVTIAGRSCKKYSYDYNILGNKAKAEYCIDKETGVCMKYFIEGSAGGESGS